MPAPKWMSKHPCTACGTGYGFCSQGWIHSLMCCKECEHPSRREDMPYTSEEYMEMWEGKEMPKMVKDSLKRIIAEERRRKEAQ